MQNCREPPPTNVGSIVPKTQLSLFTNIIDLIQRPFSKHTVNDAKEHHLDEEIEVYSPPPLFLFHSPTLLSSFQFFIIGTTGFGRPLCATDTLIRIQFLLKKFIPPLQITSAGDGSKGNRTNIKIAQKRSWKTGENDRMTEAVSPST